MKNLIPPHLLEPVLRYFRRIEQAEIDLIAAGVAFYAFLAIFPAAAAIIAIWGFVSNPEVIQQEVELLRQFLPPEAFSLIADQVLGQGATLPALAAALEKPEAALLETLRLALDKLAQAYGYRTTGDPADRRSFRERPS